MDSKGPRLAEKQRRKLSGDVPQCRREPATAAPAGQSEGRYRPSAGPSVFDLWDGKMFTIWLGLALKTIPP